MIDLKDLEAHLRKDEEVDTTYVLTLAEVLTLCTALREACEALEKAHIGLSAARLHLNSFDCESGMVSSTLEIAGEALAKIREKVKL